MPPELHQCHNRNSSRKHAHQNEDPSNLRATHMLAMSFRFRILLRITEFAMRVLGSFKSHQGVPLGLETGLKIGGVSVVGVGVGVGEWDVGV